MAGQYSLVTTIPEYSQIGNMATTNKILESANAKLEKESAAVDPQEINPNSTCTIRDNESTAHAGQKSFLQNTIAPVKAGNRQSRVKSSAISLSKLSNQFWLWEVGSCLIAVALLAAIVAILKWRNGLQLPDWPYSITINTIVSLLATFMKASLLIPIAEGMSKDARTCLIISYLNFPKASVSSNGFGSTSREGCWMLISLIGQVEVHGVVWNFYSGCEACMLSLLCIFLKASQEALDE